MLNTCDDCGKTYKGEPYYTFEPWNGSIDNPEGCTFSETDPVTGEMVVIPHNCTGNECADCAGPFLEPDEDNDPRRPPVDFYDPKIHESLLWAEQSLMYA